MTRDHLTNRKDTIKRPISGGIGYTLFIFFTIAIRGTRLVAKTTEVVGIRYLMQKTGKGRRATERAKQGDAEQARQTKGKDPIVGAALHIVFG